MFPLVTVIIPTYNSEKYIKKCIESVIFQTYSNLEVIVVDNFSTDNTLLLINKYNDKRIKVFQIKNHGIIAASRNLALNNSNGRYIAFLDSDDCWKRNKIEICVDYLKVNNCAMVYHNLVVDHLNNRFEDIKKARQLSFFKIYDLIIRGNCIWNSSVVLDYHIIKDNILISESPILIGAEDFHFWLRVINLNSNVIFINENLGYYTLHPNSVSNSVNQKKLIINIIKELDFIKFKSFLVFYINFKFLIKNVLKWM